MIPRAVLLASGALLSACASPPVDPCASSGWEAAVEAERAPLESLYAVRLPAGAAEGPQGAVLVGAGPGVLPPGELLLAQGRSVAAGAGGQAAILLPDPGISEVEVQLMGETARLRVRDPECARRAAVAAPVEDMGAVPNDLVFGTRRGLVVRSGDNAVSVLGAGGELGAGIRLPEVDAPEGPRGANPWFAVLLDGEGRRAAVSAFGQGRVLIVDLQSAQVEAALLPPPVVSLAAPVALAVPTDVDGDGAPESSATRYLPRTPQALAVVAGRLWAGYTNFYAPRLGDDRPPIYLPGLLASWPLEELSAAPHLLELGCDDPQELRVLGEQELLVVCSGIIDSQGATVHAASPGALVFIDPLQERVRSRVELGDFLPGTAVRAGGSLWVGSLARGSLLRLDPQGGGEPQELAVGAEQVDSIFRLVPLPSGLVAVPSFNTDRLHFLDPLQGRLDPAPFFAPLILGPGRPIFDGLQILATRPGRPGVDHVGPELFALAGIASRLTPIELRKVYGP